MDKPIKVPFEEFVARFQSFKQSRWPRLLGRLALAVFDDNFSNGGFTDKIFIRWKPRKGDTENKGRRLGDGGRQQGRAILIRSGRLRRSLRIAYALPAQLRLVAGNQDVPYAGIHNEGGKLTGTVQVRSFERSVKGKPQTVQAHSRSLNITMPRRQFMGRSQKLMDQADRKFFDELNKLWRAS